MGSSSNAVDQTSNTTTNLALSRDAINQSGTQILDSIIVDPSDEVMKKMVDGLQASFEVMVSGNKVGMDQIVSLGEEVLRLADQNQITMAGVHQSTLRANIDWMKNQMEMGKYVIDFSSAAVSQSYDFAGDALQQNSKALERALDLAADVKTGDHSEIMKFVVSTVTLFALAAMYLATKRKS